MNKGGPDAALHDTTNLSPDEKEGLISELQRQLIKGVENPHSLLQLALENISRCIASGTINNDELFTTAVAEQMKNGLRKCLVFECVGLGTQYTPLTFKQMCEQFQLPPELITEIVTKAAQDLVFDTTWQSPENEKKSKQLLSEYNVSESILNADR